MTDRPEPAAPPQDIPPAPAIAGRRWWLALAAFQIGLGVLAAAAAPVGGWPTQFWGLDYHSRADPDGWYTMWGLSLEQPEAWPGHPGLPVVLVVRGVARLLFVAAAPVGTGEDFEAFAVHHLVGLTFAARCAMVAVSFCGTLLVHRLSLWLFRIREVAALSAVAFATAWPVLFYLDRLSPEPFVVVFCLAVLLSTASAIDAGARGQTRCLALSAVLAGAASAAALYSKFTTTAALPLFALASLLCARRSLDSGRAVAGVERARAAALFLAAFIVIFALVALVFDWNSYFRYWFHYSETGRSYAEGSSVLRNLVAGAPAFLGSLARRAFGNVVEGFVGRPRQVHEKLVELAYLGLAAFGVLMALRPRFGARRRVVWIAIFALLSAPVALFRNFMHYWFVHTAIAAPFFGFALWWVGERWLAGLSRRRRLAALVGAAALVHAGALASFAALTLYDARAYARDRSCLRAAARLPAGERVQVLSLFHWMQVTGAVYPLLSADSALRRAFDARFAFGPGEASGSALLVWEREADSGCRAIRRDSR